MIWITVLLTGIILCCLWSLLLKLKIKSLKENGLYPIHGDATNHDVVCLYRKRHRVVAYCLYREIHKGRIRQMQKGFLKLVTFFPRQKRDG